MNVLAGNRISLWRVLLLAAVLVGIAVIFILATVSVVKRISKPAYSRIVPDKQVVVTPELDYARQLYVQRGGKYIWGANDCSVFVGDYMKALSSKVPDRLTTKELARPSYMAKYGFKLVRDNPKPGDIYVFRYLSRKSGGPMGHCGIVVDTTKGLQAVQHNSGGEGGLTTFWHKDFMKEVRGVGTDPEKIWLYRYQAEAKKPMAQKGRESLGVS